MLDKRLRVTRTIVLEGPMHWVNTTLENSVLQLDKGKIPMGPRGGYMEEVERKVEEVNG